MRRQDARPRGGGPLIFQAFGAADGRRSRELGDAAFPPDGAAWRAGVCGFVKSDFKAI